MKFSFTRVVLVFIAVFAVFSCGNRKEIVYLQNIDSVSSYESSKSYEAKLQPDDLLSIIVSADSPEVTAPFNLPDFEGNDAENRGFKTYLIDSSGFIDFPILGKQKLGGLTRTEAHAKLVTAISEYINNPTINLRIVNYKISVLGEVLKPNSYTISGERITILEAISMAGDLTIYGKRENVLVIREVEGKKTFARLDLTKSDILNSPFYYLGQNDVVFVEPNKTKINSSKIGPDVSVIISSLSVLIALGVLLTR